MIDGQKYRHPWMYFAGKNDATAKAYFDGQYDYFEGAWAGLNR